MAKEKITITTQEIVRTKVVRMHSPRLQEQMRHGYFKKKKSLKLDKRPNGRCQNRNGGEHE